MEGHPVKPPNFISAKMRGGQEKTGVYPKPYSRTSWDQRSVSNSHFPPCITGLPEFHPLNRNRLLT